MMSVDALTGGVPVSPAFDFDGSGAIDADGDTKNKLGILASVTLLKKGCPLGYRLSVTIATHRGAVLMALMKWLLKQSDQRMISLRVDCHGNR